MQTLKSFLDQAFQIWKDSTGAARFGIGLLLLLCVGAIVGVGIWSSQPHYVVLATDLSPDQMRKIISELEGDNIRYELKGSGSIIRVDKRKLARAQMAADASGIRTRDAGVEAPGMWVGPKAREEIYRQNLQRSLVNTIEGFRFIDSASVILTIPPKEAFVRKKKIPSASVLLGIVGRESIGDSQVASIAAMVASAVEGLTPDRVSISDTDGTSYTTDPNRRRMSRQDDIRLARDRELEGKAERMLAPIVGLGNSVVTVTTDFSFPDVTETIDDYDPDKKVIAREDIETHTTTKGPASGSQGSDPADRETIVKDQTESTQYALWYKKRTETTRTPVLNRLSVSVLVNPVKVMDENNQIPSDMTDRISALVQTAVGFRTELDDVKVEFYEFVDFVPLETPVAFTIPWDRVNQVLKSLSLGMAALVALLVGFRVLKKIQPDPVATSDSQERSGQVDQLSELVKQNPEVFSKIIESWSNLDAPSDVPQKSKAA